MGKFRRQVQRPAGRVTAEIGALGAAQHFQAFQVLQLRVRGLGRIIGNIEFIQVNTETVGQSANAGKGICKVTDAAHAEAHGPMACFTVFSEIHIRRDLEIVLRLFEMLLFEGFR